MTVTQKQIAEHLGISRSIVGDALQGRPRVSEATRQRVLEAAKGFGYSETSNLQARSLIAKRYGTRVATGVLAVILPIAGSRSQIASPFHSELLAGIEIAADERGLDVFISGWRPDRPAPRFIANQYVDAVICLGNPHDWAESIVQSGVPIVSFFQTGGDVSLFASYHMSVDNRVGAREATLHLSALGHRKIAYLGQSPDFETSRERLAGYREGLQMSGIEPDEKQIEATINMFCEATEAVQRLRERANDWTALVCYNDLIAMDAITALKSNGIRVPDDVSVVGFDDISVQEHFQPTLTSISFDRFEMGRSAVDLVRRLPDDRSAEAGTNPPVTAQFPVHLVVRESTASISV